MNWKLIFSRDSLHLWIVSFLVIAGGSVFVWGRGQLVPETYGEQGPYRAAALEKLASKPSVLVSDSVCLKCHADVGEERAESLHKAVSCNHCHGLGREHVVQAQKAAKTPGLTIDSAKEWDGNFMTHIDLFITQDRATCLVCHESMVGMPEGFKQINVAEHLEDMGAEEVKGRDVCFECHMGHDTAP
ncbi:MAG: hypothetical protein HON53_02020 [Planctomycetaceae bacterium]|jgi:hypothetical protein|nr:hypothetical protein [Planctomycetaceae bacterium]MBT6153159.1 hypothetical protein [Planctomycetaceae bacterium]MBT6485861.1 hypothetical protein [Planctomycetaceae bacterium]